MEGKRKKPIEQALSSLKTDGIVAFPTDTVYGIGADYRSENAVKRIHKLKGRKKEKPLTLLLPDSEGLSRYIAKVPKTANKLIDTLWPGPITLILKASGEIPPYLLGPHRTVGVRVTGHEIAQALITAFGSPIATSSANLSGGEPLRTGSDVLREFGNEIDFVLPGYCGTAPPSVVLDISSFPPTIKRSGEISPLLIARTLGRRVRLSPGIFFRVLIVCTGNACRSPIAEGLLKEMLPQPLKKKVIVSSAGTAPMEGASPTPDAVTAARELGADIAGLVSKRLSPQVISSADLVLTMERMHRDRIAELVPEAWKKTHLLKGYGQKGIPAFEREIRDPIGMPLDFYRTTAQEIKNSLKGVVRELTRYLLP